MKGQHGFVMLIVYLVLIGLAAGTIYAAWSAFTGKYVDQGIADATKELQPKIDAAIKERDVATAQKEEAHKEVRRLLGLNEDLSKRFDELVADNQNAFDELDRRTREAGNRARAAIVKAQANATRHERELAGLRAQAQRATTTPSAEQWPDAEALLRAAAARRALGLIDMTPPEKSPGERALRLSPP